MLFLSILDTRINPFIYLSLIRVSSDTKNSKANESNDTKVAAGDEKNEKVWVT